LNQEPYLHVDGESLNYLHHQRTLLYMLYLLQKTAQDYYTTNKGGANESEPKV
jgi:hypothetical protein